jgi:hypothetical protein
VGKDTLASTVNRKERQNTVSLQENYLYYDSSMNLHQMLAEKAWASSGYFLQAIIQVIQVAALR